MPAESEKLSSVSLPGTLGPDENPELNDPPDGDVAAKYVEGVLE